MRKTSLFAAALLVAIAFSPLPARAAEEGEHLIAHYPKEWLALPVNRQGNLTVVQLLPAGQSPQDYVESIIVQRREGDRQAPKELAMGIVEGSRAHCEGVVVSPVDQRPVNGYPAAEVRFACTKSSRNGKSGLMEVKAIAGTDALHVIQRVWFGPPVGANQPVPVPETTITAWDAFDNTVILCDAHDRKHPCPAPEAEAGQ